MQWGASGTAGQGMLATVVAATGAGTQSFATDNVNGRYFTHATGITAATKAGYRSNISTLLTRQFNPRMKFRLMLPATSDYTLSRGYFGFTTNTEPTGDDALNARAGFMIGWISGGTNFIVQRNDGTGATDVSGNVAGSAQALDTALAYGIDSGRRTQLKVLGQMGRQCICSFHHGNTGCNNCNDNILAYRDKRSSRQEF